MCGVRVNRLGCLTRRLGRLGPLGGRLREEQGSIGLRALAVPIMLSVAAVSLLWWQRRRDLAGKYVPELVVLFVFLGCRGRLLAWRSSSKRRD